MAGSIISVGPDLNENISTMKKRVHYPLHLLQHDCQSMARVPSGSPAALVRCGARAIVWSSSDEKLAKGRKLGAAYTIDYNTNLDW
ncbi:hypothetical protein EJ05DRAFT_504313 [Pseudovirgaria hyperparasitica]|uniref:Uncharacterized protein n=1 Tax=Pseudovirgaria hyperparasitica TaxID=470096 RepID=A0A6A6VVF8_9PEZI|nr:uncharacterized protein EJ05DRAFT_504313 [Pseudovirgaria hyperparasitica]KAF2754213.1 hypothetical protein EJ05DRAFT_504313 [Pseudovirgaria hyperparasitica]